MNCRSMLIKSSHLSFYSICFKDHSKILVKRKIKCQVYNDINSQAQNALNNCVLSNTTILATTTEEQEVENIVRTLSQHSGGNPPSNGAGRGSNPSTPFSGADYNTRLAKSSSAGDTWSALGSGVSLGWPSSGLGGSVWGAPDNDQHNRTTPLNSFLPPDLLSEGM